MSRVKYEDLTSRNWGFLSSDEQKKIADAKISIAGCGLGALIAVLAVRMGFQHITLADGDFVEKSNCNRQPFTEKDIGLNKALVTSELLLGINPEARIIVHQRFVRGEEEIRNFLHDTQFLVNTVDMGGNYLQFNEIAREQHIPVFFPLNIGWSGSVIVFSSDSPSLQEMLGLHDSCDGEAITANLVQQIVQNSEQHHLLPLLKSFLEKKEDWPCDPQMGVAALISASLTVSAIAKLVIGQVLPYSPRIITLDAWNALS